MSLILIISIVVVIVVIVICGVGTQYGAIRLIGRVRGYVLLLKQPSEASLETTHESSGFCLPTVLDNRWRWSECCFARKMSNAFVLFHL